jgi:hypothetical protein
VTLLSEANLRRRPRTALSDIAEPPRQRPQSPAPPGHRNRRPSWIKRRETDPAVLAGDTRPGTGPGPAATRRKQDSPSRPANQGEHEEGQAEIGRDG